MKRGILILLLFLSASFAIRADEAADSLSLGAVVEVDLMSSGINVFIDEESIEIVDNEVKTYPRSSKNPYKFHATELIVPGTFLAFGIAGLKVKGLKNLNKDIKDDLQKHEHKKLRFDNVTMFLPAVAGYGMNLLGFKGKHDVVDATILYATTYLLVAATALPMKYAINSERPNLKNDHSFPSVHTTIAFAGAELLRREYWNRSPWIGVAGYGIATLTAFMRLYNNAHWLTDVVAGTGLGILCAEAAYWLYPVITKSFFKKRFKANVFLTPAVSSTDIGVACIINF